MFKQELRSGVTLITLEAGEVWTGKYIDGRYCEAFVKMIEGAEGFKDSSAQNCPSHRQLGDIVIKGPAVFERHYHNYM